MANCKNQWGEILDQSKIDARHALTASIDPRFAAADRAFYESRTASDLRVLVSQAWNCNEPTAYQIARSYLALRAAV